MVMEIPEENFQLKIVGLFIFMGVKQHFIPTNQKLNVDILAKQ